MNKEIVAPSLLTPANFYHVLHMPARCSLSPTSVGSFPPQPRSVLSLSRQPRSEKKEKRGEERENTEKHDFLPMLSWSDTMIKLTRLEGGMANELDREDSRVT